MTICQNKHELAVKLGGYRTRQMVSCSYFHVVTNVTLSPANNEAHTLSTAIHLIDKVVNNSKYTRMTLELLLFILFAQNVKDQKIILNYLPVITRLEFWTSWFSSDRRCFTAFFTLTQIDGHLLIVIFKQYTFCLFNL